MDVDQNPPSAPAVAASATASPNTEHERQHGWLRWFPLPETTLLTAALLITAGAKLIATHRIHASDLLVSSSAVIAGDIVFFAACFTLFQLLALILPRALASRLVVAAAALLLLWSALDAAWLLYSGVQLQPGILRVIGFSPEEFWPHVGRHLSRRKALALTALAFVSLLVGWTAFRLIKPVSRRPAPRNRLLRVAASVVLIISLSIAQPYLLRSSGLFFSGEVLEHSTHWYALVALTHRSSAKADDIRGRHMPRAGERDIARSLASAGENPNVILLLLESVSHQATSLGENGAATPNLEMIASTGIEFVSTRVPVSQTGKAYWSTLTGTRPDLHYDYTEAVLVDHPYENLATILSRSGYRSAFFEMSKGTFQCAPGVFANMGFDWGWWRENLEDPSVAIGYLGGDDFRMLDPAMAWVDTDSRPFLLMMITSVSHDPYILPEWYGETPKSRDAAYYKAVEFNDAFVGEVLKRLDERGLSDNTIVCVLGDHGESLRAEAERSRWIPYEEVIRVPWVVRWPRHVQRGQRITWPCSQMDVTPTLLSIMGYDISAAGFEGRNALEPIDEGRRLYFSSWFEDSPEGFIEGNRKYVYWPYLDKVFTVDLVADPHERSPWLVEGDTKPQIIADLADWKQASYVYFAPHRFRERLLFNHWQAFASGRSAWAYYLAEGRDQQP